MLGDITSKRLIVLKGLLFLTLGLFSAALLLALAPDWRIALLLAISVWAFCRFYYFAFYVLEKYVDPNRKYTGVVSGVAYGVRRLWKG